MALVGLEALSLSRSSHYESHSAKPDLEPNLEPVFSNERMVLLSGRANPTLAAAIGRILNRKIDQPVTLFPDGEVNVEATHDLHSNHVFIIQPTSPPEVNTYLMELLLMIDAVRRASGGQITAVIPYYGYARQDQKAKPKVPISAAAVAEMIRTVGADRIITIDIHSTQIQGFFPGPWDNLFASFALAPKMREYNLENSAVVAPDVGDTRRAVFYVPLLGLELDRVAIVHKEKNPKTRETKALYLVGDVKGKDVWLVDDMIAGGGTIVHGAEIAKENGANRILAAVTHGLFLGDALKRINNSPIEKVLVTDTIAQRKEVLENPKVEMVTIAPLLAEAILRTYRGQPLETLFV